MTKRPFQLAKGPTIPHKKAFKKIMHCRVVGNRVIEPRIVDIDAIMAVLVETAVEEPVGLTIKLTSLTPQTNSLESMKHT